MDSKNNMNGQDCSSIKENNSVKLIPAIIQDCKTKDVLMLAYMSKDSLKKSIETRTTWFWSRQRKKLWNKGETSGNVQKIKEIEYDCDGDTLLVKVEQVGNACHTGSRSCFFRSLDIKTRDLEKINWNDLKFSPQGLAGQDEQEKNILDKLYSVIEDRIKSKSKNSYTYSLHKKGLDEILKKVGEESVEIILASKHQGKERIISEIADLIYHLLVLMVNEKITLSGVYGELKSRRK